MNEAGCGPRPSPTAGRRASLRRRRSPPRARGWLVSKGEGGRASGPTQPPAFSRSRSLPVRTKPCASSATQPGATPCSDPRPPSRTRGNGPSRRPRHRRVAPGDVLEVLTAASKARRSLCWRRSVMFGVSSDAPGSGNATCSRRVLTANQDVRMLGRLGEVRRGLARRVAAADDGDLLLTRSAPTRSPRWPRNDADALELRKIGDVELSDMRRPSRGRWRGSSTTPVGEGDADRILVAMGPLRAARDDDAPPNFSACVRARAPSPGPICTSGDRDNSRSSELDAAQRRASRLPTTSTSGLPSAIDRRRETAWSGAAR